MARILTALLVALLTALPAYSDTALARFDALLQSNSIPVHGASGSVITPGTKPADLRIDFKPEATQVQKNQAATLANSFDWLDKADATPAKFLDDVWNDGALTAATKRDVSQMALWYRIGDKAIALKIWTLLSGGASAAAIRQHAANNNITLP